MSIDRVVLIEQCKANFVNKYIEYCDDIQIKSFNTNYYKWINRCDENDVLFLLIDMIDKYTYVPRKYIYEQWDTIYQYINSITSPIVYSWIKKNKVYNSSYDYIRDFINTYNIDDKLFLYKITESNIRDNYNIILIDDIAGTGNTLLNYLKNHIFLSQKNVTIYYFVYFCTNIAYNLITNYCKKNDINIHIFGYGCLKYEFKDKNIKELFNNYSRQYIESRTYRFGFNNSQLLVSFYNNTPNNTFGIFWQTIGTNMPLFYREKR